MEAPCTCGAWVANVSANEEVFHRPQIILNCICGSVRNTPRFVRTSRSLWMIFDTLRRGEIIGKDPLMIQAQNLDPSSEVVHRAEAFWEKEYREQPEEFSAKMEEEWDEEPRAVHEHFEELHAQEVDQYQQDPEYQHSAPSAEERRFGSMTVSYTHLTLPTIYSV